MHRAFLASLLIACGSHGSSTPTTTTTTAPASAALPAGPPRVTPGERMSYRLNLQGMELAAMSFTVGEVADVAGRPAIVVQGHAKSVGLANMVAKVDDTFTSWLDVETGRSRRFETQEFATGSKTDIEYTTIDLAGRTGDTIPISSHDNDKPPEAETQKATAAEVWDYNAFLIALRSWEGAPGSAVSLEVFRSRYLWKIDVKIGKKERLTTELGDFPALRFDAHGYKLDRAGGKFPNSDERDFSIWISDDDGRVPLKLVAKTDYGDVKMEIVDYQPGTGERLRK